MSTQVEVQEFISSGILELYAMGQLSAQEQKVVEDMAGKHKAISDELDFINFSLEQLADEYAVEPDVAIKPFLMATIDYMARLEAGEAPTFPPELHEGSKREDYKEWLENKEYELQEPLQLMHAKIIGYTPTMTTAIVWLEKGAPPETHTDEFEKFMIVEGTCNIMIDGEDNHLVPGDVLIIPLFKEHLVQVTSNIPCKIILQRVAA